MKKLSIGDIVPDFTLSNQKGEEVSLSDFRGKFVVLYFYPKDDTPGCTKEACTFRDAYQDFKDNGAEVLGVSSDDEASHKAFAGKYNVPFHLLSDKKGFLRKQLGVKKTLGVIPGRETFIIDKEGELIHRFNSLLAISKHVEDALLIIKD
ncbi:MAG: peroxiredoxin [Cyclobacteriaceae bacterium]